MRTEQRIDIYARGGRGKLTPRQMRRLVKKAGREPGAVVERDNGMGYSRGTQGCRILVGFERRNAGRPSAGTGQGHHAVDAWIDEPF